MKDLLRAFGVALAVVFIGVVAAALLALASTRPEAYEAAAQAVGDAIAQAMRPWGMR